MSVMNRAGRKILLPRSGDELWEAIEKRYVRDDRRVWRRLAMFALSEAVGWPVERIATTFGRDTEHVARCVQRTRRDLRRRFGPDDRESIRHLH